MKGVRIDHYPPGYDVTRDHIPPRQASLAPFVGCGVILLLIVFAAGAIISYMATQRKQTAALATAEHTPEATIDSWGATGTALYWQTFTPTPTLSPTPTETDLPTVEHTPEATTEPSPTPDAWQSTGTAIYLTLSGAEVTPEVQGSAARMTPRPPTRTPAPVDPNPQPAPQRVITIVVTKQVVLPPVTRVVVVTATARPPTRTPAPEATSEPSPTPTLLPSATFTATPSETPMSPTPTPSETPTLLPSATFTPTFTETLEPTYTPTFTETPTETPTEVLPE